MNDLLPFSAVVGQDDAKLALILAACQPRIGGVLLRGDKGSGKTTLARGLAALLPGKAPFVELPVGATEDRVVGTLDLAAALTGGEKRFDPGLLHSAHGGVLYVDEINLLPDHLVDVLLDVAATGVNRVEREGVSHTHPSRFLLVGSMNPEEGDLRPQLLDRFGLAVEVRTAIGTDERSAALRRRLDFDDDPAGVRLRFGPQDADVAERLAAARPATVSHDLAASVAALCAAAGAEGLRADLTICRAAAALAGWEGRAEADASDVRRVAPLALAHRARRDPLDTGSSGSGAVDEAIEELFGPAPETDDCDPSAGGDGSDDGRVASAANVGVAPIAVAATRRREPAAPGRRAAVYGPRGRVVGARPPDGVVGSVAVGATVRQAASRRAGSGASGPTGPGPLVEAADVQEAIRVQRRSYLVVLAVDASGSMGASERMEMAKGAAIALLRDAYQNRDQVALVAFRGHAAEVLLRPTGSVEVARARLRDLPTGGRTPLAAGLKTALTTATNGIRGGDRRPLIILVTDGRATSATGAADPVEAALACGAEVARVGVDALVIDVEGAGPTGGGPRLGLARRLAEVMGASYVPISDLTPSALEGAVRRAVAG